jgi:hypothetical protein
MYVWCGHRIDRRPGPAAFIISLLVISVEQVIKVQISSPKKAKKCEGDTKARDGSPMPLPTVEQVGLLTRPQ